MTHSKAELSGPQLEVCIAHRDLDAYVVIDRAVCSRACGGLRIAPDVARQEVQALARLMTEKFALFGIACGGAKAGLVLPPDLPRPERHAALARLGRALAPLLRRGIYIAGEDLGSDHVDLWHMYRGAGMAAGAAPTSTAGAGAHGTGHVAGIGAAMVAVAALDHLAQPIAGATVAIEGFGRVGSAAARELGRRGVRLRCASNAYGAITGDALDPDALTAFLAARGDAAIGEFPGGRALPREALFDVSVDVLMPCARPASIRADNVAGLRCRIVAPGGNCTVTSAAEEGLHARGVLVVPDALAAGSAILVAHFSALGLSSAVRDWLLYERFPALCASVLAQAEAEGQPPASVVHALTTRHCKRDANLCEPPWYERLLARLGRSRLRRFLPIAAEQRLVRRICEARFDGRGLAVPVGSRVPGGGIEGAA